MRTRTLGTTGLDVSPIGIGAWQLAGPLSFDGKPDGHPDPGKRSVLRMIHQLGDMGVNTIDTAEQYGNGESERRVGEAIRGQRDKWIVSTKFGYRAGPDGSRDDSSSPQTIVPSIEGSLKRLGTDYIDVYHAWQTCAARDETHEEAMMSDSHIGRRKFMQYSVAGAALAASSNATGGAHSVTLPKPAGAIEEGITAEADVLIVGGGTAGTIAALQASRAGAKTLLVERGSQLGGTTTTGGVAFPGLFDAWGKQIIAGIGWELVKESVELDGGTLPDFSKAPRRHWMNQVKVNQFLYPILAEEKCEQAGVEIAYYEFPQAIARRGDGWLVDCAGFGTQRRVLCKQIIDCTGGAEVVGLLNLARLREAETQPGSMLFRLGKPYEAGRTGTTDALYIHGAESTNSRTVTAANLKGRKDLLGKIRSSGERLMHMQPEASFRESYRIVGETTITVDDYTSGRIFDDALCYAFYPVDLHTKSGVKPEPLKPGTVPTVPLRALIPKGSRNIMVAGRSVSSDRLANSGLRVQASCMAMGQAAGAASALAVQQNATPLEVPLADIRNLLRKHGAIVPQS